MSRRRTIQQRFIRSYALILALGLILTAGIAAVIVREAEIRRETVFLSDRTVLLADLIDSVSSLETSMPAMNRQLQSMNQTEGLLFYLMDEEPVLDSSRAADTASLSLLMGGQGGQGGMGGPGGGSGAWGVDLQNSETGAILSDLLTMEQMVWFSEPSDEPRVLRIPAGSLLALPNMISGWQIDSGTLFVLRDPENPVYVGSARLLVADIGIVAGFAVVAVLSYFLLRRTIRRILRPLTDIGSVAESVVDGRYDRRLPAYPEEELAAIGYSVNRMMERLDKLESMRLSFTAQLAHELRTPLTILRLSLQGIRDGVVSEREVPEFIQSALDETTRLQRLSDDLVDLSVLESSDFPLDIRDVDMAEEIRQVVAETRPACQKNGQELMLSVPEHLPASVDADRIRQVLLNILGNSIRHAGAGREIRLTAQTHGGLLHVSIRDNGPGIPEDQIGHMFERYGRGGSSAGSGLGLAISRAIIEAHGGQIRAASDGATYTDISFSVPV